MRLYNALFFSLIFSCYEACVRLNGPGLVFDVNDTHGTHIYLYDGDKMKAAVKSLDEVVKVNMKADLLSQCVNSVVPSDIWRCLNQTACGGRANITHMTFNECDAPVEIPFLPLVGDGLRLACFCHGLLTAASCGQLDYICPGYLDTRPEAAGFRACPVP